MRSEVILQDWITEEQVNDLALVMREVEREDCLRQFASVQDAILYAWALSDAGRRAVVVGGQCVCAFGVVPSTAQEGLGIPWMMSADLPLYVSPATVVRISRESLDASRSRYSGMFNYVPAEDDHAIEFLQIVGFRVSDQQVERAGGAYRAFEWRAP